MNTTLLTIGLLTALVLLAIIVTIRMRRQRETQPTGEMVALSTSSTEEDDDAYREVFNSLAARFLDMPASVAMIMDQRGREAAREAFQQATETGTDTNSARKAAIDAYRTALETMVATERWQADWRKNAWMIDRDAYEKIAASMGNEHEEILLHSNDAISRVLEASAEAAIQAYRRAGEGGLDAQAMRSVALSAYRTTLEARLLLEQSAETTPWNAAERLKALPTAQIKRIERRMTPAGDQGMRPSGVFSVTGFLASEESLIQRIEVDERALGERGITPEQVADRLESLVGQASRLLDLARRGRLDPERTLESSGRSSELLVSERFLLKFSATMGYQECPFEDEQGRLCRNALFGDTDFTLKNVRTHAVLNFPGLIIHLIRSHHFFEGAVPYRVDPLQAVKVLELQPGVDYKPGYKMEAVWRWREGTGNTADSALDSFPRLRAIKNDPEVVMELAEGVCLYFRGDRCLSIAEKEYQVPDDFTAQGAFLGSKSINRGVGGWSRSEELFVVTK